MHRAVLLGSLLVLLVLPGAAAHGDATTIRWSDTLAPGDAKDVERAIHWHRLVGTIQADDAINGLTLSVTGPEGTTEIPVARDGRVNALIRCCLGTLWSDHQVRLSNQGPETVEVQVVLTLLHDDFAVIEDGSEGGTGTSVLLLSAMTAAAAWRSRPRAEPDPAAARRWLRLGGITMATAWGLMIALSLIGMLRFGGGPLLGSLTVFAFMPLTHPLLNSHLVGKLLLFGLWTTALFAWSGARRWAEHPSPREHVLAAAILIGGPLFAILFTLEYSFTWVAIGYGIVPVAAFVAVRWLAQGGPGSVPGAR